MGPWPPHTLQATAADLAPSRADAARLAVVPRDGAAQSELRIGQLAAPEGKEMTPIDELGPGDIGAVAKLRETRAGDVLAGEALEILNSSKITTLIVADAGKPVGIVHLHDFLRAGVA